MFEILCERLSRDVEMCETLRGFGCKNKKKLVALVQYENEIPLQ